jgi:polyphosphate kinase
VYYFHSGGKEKLYLASADWMTRNMERRVELLIPMHSPSIRKRLKEYLVHCLHDNVKARVMQEDGSYRKIKSQNKEPFDSQQYFQELARKANQTRENGHYTLLYD